MATDLNAIGSHPNPPTWPIARRIMFGAGFPTDVNGYEGKPYIDQDTGDIYIYQSGSWVLTSSGGGGGGGGGNPEVFSLAGSASPGAAPVGGAGVAYNAVGDVWVHFGGAWVKTISA